MIERGGVRLDPITRRAWRGDVTTRLRRTSAKVLAELMLAPRGLTKSQLWERLYSHRPESEWPDLDTVDVHVHHLRAALERLGLPRDAVKTVHGVGYFFDAPPDTAREVSVSPDLARRIESALRPTYPELADELAYLREGAG